MKPTTFFSMVLVGLIISLCVIGPVMADPSVSQTPEIQGISTGTTMQVTGLAMENDQLTWQISNINLSTKLALPGHSVQVGPYIVDWPAWGIQDPTKVGQVMYTTAYSEDTSATNGQITYIKTMLVNTGNQVISQSNVKAEKTVTFEGADAGEMISSENLMLDGAGQFDYSSLRMLCPFAATDSTFIPQFCNIVQTGSSVDVTTGKLVTSTSDRFVSATADAPVTLAHSISLAGVGSKPASGSANAYLKVHVQEGRMNKLASLPDIGATIYTSGKTEDLIYSESNSATGLIPMFTKSMSYQSGKLLV
jgi:hypothetical protein